MIEPYKPQRGDITQPMVLTIGTTVLHNHSLSPVRAAYHYTLLDYNVMSPLQGSNAITIDNLYSYGLRHRLGYVAPLGLVKATVL